MRLRNRFAELRMFPAPILVGGRSANEPSGEKSDRRPDPSGGKAIGPTGDASSHYVNEFNRTVGVMRTSNKILRRRSLKKYSGRQSRPSRPGRRGSSRRIARRHSGETFQVSASASATIS